MPKFAKYDHMRTQTSTFTYWEQIYTLLPKDDPLCDDVLKARKESLSLIDFSYEENGEFKNVLPDDDTITVENDLGEKEQVSSHQLANEGVFDLGIPKQFDVENKWIQDHLKSDIELLNKIEEKYKDQPGHDFLIAQTKNLRFKESMAMEGVTIDTNPASALYNGFKSITKMQDTLCDLEPEEKHNSHDIRDWTPKPANEIESAMKHFGIPEIIDDYTEMQEHGAEWVKEWNNGSADPQKLREIAEKMKETADSLEEDIEFFEQKYLEDAKLPLEERKILKITSKSSDGAHDLIGDFASGNVKKDDRCINGPHWEMQKKAFENTLESHLIAADLMYAQRQAVPNSKLVKKTKNEYSKLPGLIDELVDGCTAELFMADNETKRGKDKRSTALPFVMQAAKMMELKTVTEKYPEDAFAQAVHTAVEEHLKEPVFLDMLSKYENQQAQKQVESIKIKQETDRVKAFQNDMRRNTAGQDDVQPGKTPEEHFEQQKELTAGYAAKIIAAQLAAKTVKSYKAGMEELAAQGGNAVSKKELDEMVKDMLSEKNINDLAADIKERDDFKRMMDDVNDWKTLNFLREDAFKPEGKGLVDRLAKAQKELITESRERNRLDPQAEMSVQDPKLGGPAM